MRTFFVYLCLIFLGVILISADSLRAADGRRSMETDNGPGCPAPAVSLRKKEIDVPERGFTTLTLDWKEEEPPSGGNLCDHETAWAILASFGPPFLPASSSLLDFGHFLSDREPDATPFREVFLSMDHSARVVVPNGQSETVRVVLASVSSDSGSPRIQAPGPLSPGFGLRQNRVFTAGTHGTTCGDLQIHVPVSIDLADDILSFQLRMYYPAEALILTSVQKGAAFNSFSLNYQTGSGVLGDFVTIAAAGTTAIAVGTGTAVMVNLVFDVNVENCDDAVLDLAFLEPSKNGYALGDYSEYTAVTLDGSLTVDCPANPPLGSVTNFSPSNGATGLPVDLTLDWSDVSNADAYTFYLDQVNPPVQVEGSGLGISEADLTDLPWETTLYWKVTAYNAGNLCSPVEGPVWSFTTQSQPIGPRQVADGSVRLGKEGGNILLFWGPSCGIASDYTIYEGDISAGLRLGTYTHRSRICFDSNSDLREEIDPRFDAAYYLVVPRTSTGIEGGYGFGRPAGDNDAGCPITGHQPEECP
ncbi:MAG TPA: hypothetical protein PK014_08645 [Thermoanaerobaculia bacterium]|nr:hypothetical protein [Thermoanaerobaculia bacterium]HUM30256.1 hypothetical protein [Thermoanaerobaculia bacterium]HXK68448.1 hypothetical protein [Thermoanaerobaculia bacterium]